MYTVIDYRECEVIGKYDTLAEAKAAALAWEEETNGDCDVKIANAKGKIIA